MESAPHKKQKPLYLIFLMCSVLLLVIVIGLFLLKSSTTSEKIASAAACDYDRHVCQFLQKLHDPDQFYAMPLTATISVSTMNKPTGQVMLAADTNNNVYVTSSESGKIQAELLVIGDALYKKTASGTWQQQEGADSQAFLQFRQKALNEANIRGKTTTYTALGKENCGLLTCFKYQITAPSLGSAKVYVFFDTTMYLLRKIIHQAQNTTTETTFAYTPLTITPPTQ